MGAFHPTDLRTLDFYFYFYSHIKIMKTVYVLVAVKIDDELDPYEVIENCDYSFSLEGNKLGTEITEVYDHDETRLF